MKVFGILIIGLCTWFPSAFAQVAVEMDCTVPYYGMRPAHRPDELRRDDISSGEIVAQAWISKEDIASVEVIDTLIVCPSLLDHAVLPGLGHLHNYPFEYFLGFNNWIDYASTYTLRTRRIWRRLNEGENFRYMDFHARLIVRDLGLHDARLINRTARRRKHMLVEKQVRVLLVEEILEMTHVPRSSEAEH